MERLTVKINGTYEIKGIEDIPCGDVCERNLGCETCKIHKAVEKLAEYEDLEEQGMLLRLPCKVRDRFWELNTANGIPHVYPRMAHSLSLCVYVLERLGKTTFLTKEEAEAALERMGKDND